MVYNINMSSDSTAFDSSHITCDVCTLSYPVINGESRCPNQWRMFSAPYRKSIMMEFTNKRHLEARARIIAHREAMARVKASPVK